MAAAGPGPSRGNFEYREEFRKDILNPLDAMVGRALGGEENEQLRVIANKLNQLSSTVIDQEQKKRMEGLSREIVDVANERSIISISYLREKASSIFHAVYFDGNQFGDLPPEVLGMVGEYVDPSDLKTLARGNEKSTLNATFVRLRHYLTENEKKECENRPDKPITEYYGDGKQIKHNAAEAAREREQWVNELLAYFPPDQYEEVRKDPANVLNFLDQVSAQLMTEEERKKWTEPSVILGNVQWIWEQEIRKRLTPEKIKANIGNLPALRKLADERNEWINLH